MTISKFAKACEERRLLRLEVISGLNDPALLNPLLKKLEKKATLMTEVREHVSDPNVREFAESEIEHYTWLISEAKRLSKAINRLRNNVGVPPPSCLVDPRNEKRIDAAKRNLH